MLKKLKSRINNENYFNKEIEKSELMSKKKKKICTSSKNLEHYLILPSAVTRYVSISAFDSSLVFL